MWKFLSSKLDSLEILVNWQHDTSYSTIVMVLVRRDICFQLLGKLRTEPWHNKKYLACQKWQIISCTVQHGYTADGLNDPEQATSIIWHSPQVKSKHPPPPQCGYVHDYVTRSSDLSAHGMCKCWSLYPPPTESSSIHYKDEMLSELICKLRCPRYVSRPQYSQSFIIYLL